MGDFQTALSDDAEVTGDGQDQLGEAADATTPPATPLINVGISAEVAEQWSWAAANARIPQVAALTMSAPEALRNVRVTVSVEDGGDRFGRTVALEGPLPAGVTAPRNVHVPLSARAMAGVDERRAAECVIRIEDVESGALLGEHRQAVDLQPRDLWLATGDPRRQEHLRRLRLREEHVRQQLEAAEPGPQADDLNAELSAIIQIVRDMRGRSHDLSVSLLASFARPNHPEVLALAQEAAVIRTRRLGDPSFNAFQQADVARAESDVEASISSIYEALQERQITYSEPPPGWDYAFSGQRIRDHGAVARGGLGTCLDTTVLMAAVIEHVGLNPVMILLPGHITVGYWRRNPYPPNIRPEWFPATPTVSAPDTIRTLIDGGWLGVIETTAFAAGRRVSAEAAREAARGAIVRALEEQGVSLIDVAEARMAGVSPLPAVQERADGITEVIEYRPGGEKDVTEVPTPAREPSSERVADSHPPRYRTWKGSLFTLNARNALLNLGSGPSVQPLVLPPQGLGDLEDRLNQDVEFELLSGFQIPEVFHARDIANAAQMEPDEALRLLSDRRLYVQRISKTRSAPGAIGPAKFATEVRAMARRAKEAYDERGMNPLFLCLGALRWPLKDRSGALAEAPLILVPVKIAVRRGGGFVLSLDTSAQTTPNAALIEWLRREHDLVIPSLSEPAADRAGLDVDAVLSDVRSAVAARGLAVEVVSTASLALLDLAAFRMWQDLNAHGDAFLQHPLVGHLVHTPTEAFADAAAVTDAEADTDARLDSLMTPIPADATQKRAVLWAREGRSFVLQGPPGTGKSQTITNMIAECLLAGRKVLFVAEKGTALSVVQRRLDAIGLAPFTLNLHHEGSTATQVRAQLKSALTARVTPDAAAMESAQRKLRNARYELGEFPEKLHRQNAAGLSAYSARDSLLVLGDGPTVEIPGDLIAARAELVGAVRDALERIQPLAGAAGVRAGHPWRLAGTPRAGLDVEAVSEAVRGVIAGAQWAEGAGSPLGVLLDGIRELGQFERLAALSAPELPAGETLRAVLDPQWETITSTAIAQAEEAVTAWLPSLRGFDVEVLATDLRGTADEFRQANESSFFGRSKRLEAAARRLRPFTPGGAEITAVAAQQALPELIAVQQTAEAIAANLGSVPGITVESKWNPFRPDAFRAVRAQYEALARLTARARVASTWDDAARDAAVAGHLTAAASHLVSLASAWTGLWNAIGATQSDAAAWAQGGSPLAAVRLHAETWRRHADHERLIPLQRWLALVDALEPLALAGLASTRAQILDGAVRVDELEDAFDRGVARASLAERVVVEGLDRFDSRAHDERVRTYAAAERDVRREWITTGPSALLAARGGGGAGLKTGGLARELEKTRQRLGTRAILHRYGAAVQELTPLVLCSPASAVDLIEPGVMDFDLVIFDEASQITVPEAIGAIARARAVVVVGDSKQMPPTRRVGSQTAAEEEFSESGDEEIVEDQESILSECELARVPTLSLSWHYRSQDEALIAFSNRAYYDGRLSSFPTPSLLSSATGVQFVPVKGRFIRTSSRETVDLGHGVAAGKGTNPAEALAIAEKVGSLLAGEAPPTIGIVTFNEQQRLLIEDLLRAIDDPRINAAMDEAAMGPSDVLFVKALEQVQGDERDVVLFSVAFSKQDNGRIPLNFGPLSNSGGERRLNVAVTRARLKNIVFCSFDPEELDAESASFRGVKDLKEFLRFAKSSGRSDATDPLERAAIRDRHRDEVALALRECGLHVLVDVGMSDFRLDLVLARADAPDRPVLPVLLDGESWRSRHTVADRDVLPVEVLTGLMGWPSVARVWWPMWVQNRDEVIARLLEEFSAADASLLAGQASAGEADATRFPAEGADQVEEGGYDFPALRSAASTAPSLQPARSALAEGGTAEADGYLHLAEQPTGEDTDDSRAVSDVWPRLLGDAPSQVFVPASVTIAGPRDTLDHLSERRPASLVRYQLVDIINAEGPVQVARLIRLTARRFGLLKVRAARADEIKALIPRGMVRKSPLGDFAWPTGLDPESWRGYRLPDEAASRALDEVAPEELLNAMRAVVSSAPGLDDEAAIRATAKLFGISKLGAQVRARLQAVAGRLGSEPEG